MNYSITQVTTLIGAHRYGMADTNIGFLLIDSRSLCFPSETLFFALTTASGDGHHFISELYHRGVRNFCVTRLPESYDTLYPDSNFLLVPSTLAALQRLAERHRDNFCLPVVGITGSNGKTVVKEWLYQLLSPSVCVTRSPRSYNSQIGVPLSVWLLHERTRVALFEAGISQPGEMRALADIIQPTLGIITNIGDAHQENFGSQEEKCREKLRLFRHVQQIIAPMDDDVIMHLLEKEGLDGELLTWSCRSDKATLYVNHIEHEQNQTQISCVYQGKQFVYAIPFSSEASVCNSLTCALAALTLGITPEQLVERTPLLEPIAMRLEVKEGRNGCLLINDSYNSDVHSLDIALDFMCRRPDMTSSRTLVLSDIRQSGYAPEQLYSLVNMMLTGRSIDRFVGIGNDITLWKHLITAAPERHFFSTTKDFVESEVFRMMQNTTVLLKGAREFGFDRLSELMVKRVHETTLDINLNALVANLNYYRSLMASGTLITCMIKANGYGTGAVEIAKTLQEHHADYLAVAVADEGVALRRAGITQSIMVMNPEMSAFKTLFDYDLEPEVFSFRMLDALIAAARREGVTYFPIHIKLDTGMHRLGFDPEHDMERLVRVLKNQDSVIPRSVFSHFVGSDSDDFDGFSNRQFTLYDQASRQLQEAFHHRILRHICNSAGIAHFPDFQLDMCRLGLGLYGVDPRTNAILNNVASLHTTILQLRHVPASDTVGYSRRGVLERDSVIAAIPIGYADGLDRHLGRGRGYCLVNGKKAPYVGNICMDVAMIDVTGIPCQEGDPVEIFGDNLPVTQLSDWLDTIPYEILTGVSDRVQRVYYKD